MKKLFTKTKKMLCSLPQKISKGQMVAFLFLMGIMPMFAEGEIPDDSTQHFAFFEKLSDGSFKIDLTIIVDFLQDIIIYCLMAGVPIVLIVLAYRIVMSIIKKSTSSS